MLPLAHRPAATTVLRTYRLAHTTNCAMRLTAARLRTLVPSHVAAVHLLTLLPSNVAAAHLHIRVSRHAAAARLHTLVLSNAAPWSV